PPAAPRARHGYRPPLGLPLRRDSRWGTIISVLAHALLILLILAPLFQHDVALVVTQSGGGPGPRGGGGGGRQGTGGERPREEHIRYFALAPAAAPPLAAAQPPKPLPPPLAKVDVKVDAAPPPVALAPAAGIGGGTGNDGTNGMGPGSGGGVGTGTGTGIGSGTGPGTGGGGVGDTAIATNYFANFPLDHPSSLTGRTIKIRFALDSTGKVLQVEFDPTGTRSFDQELRQRLMTFKFRPAFLRSSGAPVPSVYETVISF
ncbi:MAG TPA: hypothetical protein VMT93_07195, partial [Gemmatimonadaceae bacterium]|nr:hypothetical protein [Gemmatimonadaceae bacterium]